MSSYPEPSDWLHGAIDTHIHAGPDVVQRSVDFLDAARDAHEARMAAVVFKDIGQPTVDRAFAASKGFPGLRVYGGVVLDLSVGGINPLAVEQSFRHGGRFVWMPVAHARHTVDLHRSGRVKLLSPPRIQASEAISLTSDNGGLTPQVKEVVQLIADYDGVLATGHVSPQEALEVIRFARSVGVTRLIANHPSGHAVGASLDFQRLMAQEGAFLEHCFAQTTSGLDGIPMARIASDIRAVGTSHCLLATDLGQTFNPRPVEGLRVFMEALAAEGLDWPSLERMTRTNPEQLLL